MTPSLNNAFEAFIQSGSIVVAYWKTGNLPHGETGPD
jgi:hypothetical protein